MIGQWSIGHAIAKRLKLKEKENFYFWMVN